MALGLSQQEGSEAAMGNREERRRETPSVSVEGGSWLAGGPRFLGHQRVSECDHGEARP